LSWPRCLWTGSWRGGRRGRRVVAGAAVPRGVGRLRPERRPHRGDEDSTDTHHHHIHRGQDQSENVPQLGMEAVSWEVWHCVAQHMLRNAVPNSPGDRVEGQLVAIFRFILISSGLRPVRRSPPAKAHLRRPARARPKFHNRLSEMVYSLPDIGPSSTEIVSSLTETVSSFTEMGSSLIEMGPTHLC
jgi:hypothetical protein